MSDKRSLDQADKTDGQGSGGAHDISIAASSHAEAPNETRDTDAPTAFHSQGGEDHDRTNLVTDQLLRPQGAHLRHACLFVAQPAPGGQPLLLLDGSRITVGRGRSCDLCLPNDSVSRQHLSLERLAHGWILEDLTSTNGTFVDGEKIRDRIPLTDGLSIQVGQSRIQFYDIGSHHEGILRKLLEDSATGLLNRTAMESEIGRAQRQNTSHLLALFDIDNFRGLRNHLGPVAATKLLQLVGQLLSQRASDHFATDLVGVIEEDTFAILVHDLQWSEVASHVETIRSTIKDTVCSSFKLPPDFGISAALTHAVSTQDGYADPEETIRRGVEKLLQAKFAGQDRSATSSVQPMWERRDHSRWRARARQMSSVAIGIPARPGTGSSPGAQDAIRLELARQLDSLPPDTTIAIGWLVESSLWLLAASCSQAELREMNGRLKQLELITTSGGSEALQWLDGRVSELAQRSHGAADTKNHVLACVSG